ncbi:hypothetical protein OsI_29658 [Oryza sativa Indica Group]|uniref:EVE domain-containing protein n=1 Tax=Oryza sativa subsp. indica TaxID=39946 RepID=B8BBU0_ORYSI|nr:hypothetical protein OsI_29658 [Oryza sativa Indica Group]
MGIPTDTNNLTGMGMGRHYPCPSRPIDIPSHHPSEGGRRLVLSLLLPPPKKATPNAAVVASGNCKYWLLKTESGEWSWSDPTGGAKDGNLVAAGLRDDPVSGALPWPPPRSQLDRSLVRVGAAQRWSWPCRAESTNVFCNNAEQIIQIAPWDSVCNRQAINSLYALRRGDRCLFYHSSAGATSRHIVGVMEVAREWYEGEGEAASGGAVDVRAIIFRATHWLRFWAQLQRCDEDGEFLKVACRKLEKMVMQLKANYGWRFTNRLE